MGVTDLPAGLSGKARDLHAMRGTSRTRGSTFLLSKCIARTSTTSELDCETFTHEVGTVEGCYRVNAVLLNIMVLAYQEPHRVHPWHPCTQ